MPVIASQTVQVLVQYLFNGQKAENTFYVSTVGVPASTDLDSIANEFATWLSGSWMPLMPSTVQCTGMVLTSLDSASGPVLISPISPAIAGGGQAALYNQVSFAIQRLILERFRGGHPRIYVPGMPPNHVTSSNLVSAGHADNLVDSLEDLRAALIANANTYIMSVLRSTPAPRTPQNPEAVPVVGHRYNDLVLDSQRRRLPGRGN